MYRGKGTYSVNCWLTPDASNKDLSDQPGWVGGDPKSDGDNQTGNNGGLRIYRGEGVEGLAFQKGLDFENANQDFRTLKAAIWRAGAGQEPEEGGGSTRGGSRGGGGGGSGVEVVDIPYRQNRCTIFRSNLLHETAPSLHFKPGYANRRINLTFMFGNSALWGI